MCLTREVTNRAELKQMLLLYVSKRLCVRMCNHGLVSGSQSAPSLAVSRLEQAMSEVSAISSTHRQGPAYIWTTLERIWLQAGEENLNHK